MYKSIKSFCLSLLIVSVFSVGSAMSADVAKIGVFDVQRFMENSKAGQNVREVLNKKRNQFEQSLKEKGGSIQKLREQLELGSSVMSPQKQEEKRREYRILVNDYKEMDQRYTEEIKKAEVEETRKIFDQLDKILDKIGKEENFLLIVHKSAVLYSPDQLDITDRVIKIHDKEYGANE